MEQQLEQAAPRPRVVIVHSSDEMYGADRIVLQVVDAIQEHTPADVEVWLPDDVVLGEFTLSSRLTERNVAWQHTSLPVMRRAYMTPRGLFVLGRRWFATWKRLRRARPDVVYVANSACLLVAPAARLSRVRHRVLHLQERWGGREGRLLRWLARSTGTRIAISTWVASASGLTRPAPIVIENCVDDPSPAGAPAAPEVECRPLRFVVASRWNRWKGHATLITAWEAAGAPGVLTVLGGPPTVGDAVDVRALVDQIVTCKESVEIVGEVGEITRYISDADVLVLPSDEPEPFGLVMIEAFALARPVIASNAGGPAAVIDHGHNGWLFDIGDPAALAAVLCDLDADDVSRAGAAARRDYERRFLPDGYRRRIGELLADLLAGGEQTTD